jgi:hypothetical protein
MLPPPGGQPFGKQIFNLRSLVIRLVLTIATLAIWFWTQSLIGARGLADSGIAPLNLYLHNHSAAADALLIVSSAIIDLLGIFLLSMWVFRGDLRPLPAW